MELSPEYLDPPTLAKIQALELKARTIAGYSLEIEATEDPGFFGFHSPDLSGFAGVGHSVEDCLYQARWAMREHVDLLREQGMPVPPPSIDPVVTIRNQPMAAVA